MTKPIQLLQEDSAADVRHCAKPAGTVWWDGELFSGKPNWQMLLNHPNPTIPQEEQDFLDNQVKTLCSMVDEWEISQNGDLSKEIWEYIKKERFFSMIIPKEYGGLGFSAQTQSAVLQALTVSGATFSTVGVPNSLGPGELLLKYGTQEQKDHYLPRLADGREIPCFGLTGPRAGSDATSLPDVGVVCKGWEGKEVLGLKSTEKRYHSGSSGDCCYLAFRMFDPEGLLAKADVDYRSSAATRP